MMTYRSAQSTRRTRPSPFWFERVMALLAALNLLLVVVDLSYIRWRDFYLQLFPSFTQSYGALVKGIEPHRTTENYLATVEQLRDQVALTGLQSPQTTALLEQVRGLSLEIVDENPFEGAGKSGTLERIKERMRDRINVVSAKQAFTTFWSEPYLSQVGWSEAIDFFDRRIHPLVATNYYRNIGLDGEPIDRFWIIDLGFVVLFAGEFLVRTLYLSRRYPGTSWLDAVIWRCYDLLLLLPFWRWLRIIPVVIRLNQAQLVNLNPISVRVVRTVIAGVAVEMTEMVVVRIIDQTQEAIREGEVTRWVLDSGRRYIDINGINEVEVITSRLLQVLVYQVLPSIRPNLEALLHHALTTVLAQSPAYANLQRLPGMAQWSTQLTQQLVADLTANSYHAIQSALQDEVGAALMGQLVSQLGVSFRQEIQQDNALPEIQALLIELLEEVKVNYVKQVEAADIEVLRAQKKKLYGLTQGAGTTGSEARE